MQGCPALATENPDGYYIAGLQTQLSHGDPRIIRAVGTTFHVCTRLAATPGMDQTQVHRLSGARAVSYLFVPASSGGADPNS